MTLFESPRNKDDGVSQDACPTCSAPVDTKATTDASGHRYRLECESCSWALPIERPLPAPMDDAVLVTDGGMTTEEVADGGPKSAQEILDELYHDDSVAAIADQVRTGTADPSPRDALRTLALAEDRLCLVFEHDCGLEYVFLADGWEHFEARLRRDRDGETIDTTLRQSDLQHRLDKLADVEMVGAADVARPSKDCDHESIDEIDVEVPRKAATGGEE